MHLANQFQPNPAPLNATQVQDITSASTSLLLTPPGMAPELNTPNEVKQLISSLARNKAPGKDKLPPKALKEAPPNLNAYLAALFNAILLTSHFPTAWKTAIISMLPKPRKNTKLPENYRPISLLSHLSKLFERVLLHRLLSHVQHSNLLPSHEFGFRAGHDTQCQLIRVVDEICIAINEEKYTVGVFIDIRSAFDKVWHQGIPIKLKDQLFNASYILLLASFLQNRSFQVRSENALSPPQPILAGVPQGSTLSPLLYALYTADIPTTPHVMLATNADDTAFFSRNIHIQFALAHMQRQLDLLADWTMSLRINIHVAKTRCTVFERRK